MSQKNNQVQFMRGIGCLIIVFYHLYWRYQEIYLDKTYSFFINKVGKIGVFLFLVLTGYYLLPAKEENATKYLIKRFKSIYIPYIISIIFIFIFSFSGYLGASREVSLLEFFCNALMINGFVNIQYVDGAHWYLTYIVIFISIMTIIIFLRSETKKQTYIVWIIINFILCLSNRFIHNPIVKELQLISGGMYTPFIIIGIILRNRINNKFNLKQSVILISLAYISIFYISGIFNLLISIFLTILIWSVTNNKIKKFEKIRVITEIGNYSYFIYLIHQNIGYMCINFLRLNFNFNICTSIFFTSFIIALLVYIIKYLSDNIYKICSN